MGGTATSSSTLQLHRTAERQRDVTLGLRTLRDGHAYADPYVTIHSQCELDTYSAGDPAPAYSLHRRRRRLLFRRTREQITACLPAVKGEPWGQAVICPQRWLTRFAKKGQARLLSLDGTRFAKRACSSSHAVELHRKSSCARAWHDWA